MMQNLNLMFGSQVEKSMGITLLTSLFMRFIAELKQLHQYDLKQMGLPPFLCRDKRSSLGARSSSMINW